MAFQKYYYSNFYSSFIQHLNSFILSTLVFCVINCKVDSSEAASINDGIKGGYPMSWTEGRPVTGWISFPEATLVSLGLLISVVIFVLLCSGGCCLNIFGKRANQDIRMQGFDNPISELNMGNAAVSPVTISPIDVRALQMELDAVVFEPLPSVIDLTPLPPKQLQQQNVNSKSIVPIRPSSGPENAFQNNEPGSAISFITSAPIIHPVNNNTSNNTNSSPWEPTRLTSPPAAATKIASTTLFKKKDNFDHVQNSSNVLLSQSISHHHSHVNNDDDSKPNPSNEGVYNDKSTIDDVIIRDPSNKLLQTSLSQLNQHTLKSPFDDIAASSSNKTSSNLGIPDISFRIIAPTPIQVSHSQEVFTSIVPQIATQVKDKEPLHENIVHNSSCGNRSSSISVNSSAPHLSATVSNTDYDSRGGGSDISTNNNSQSFNPSIIKKLDFLSQDDGDISKNELILEATLEEVRKEEQIISITPTINIKDINSNDDNLCNISNGKELPKHGIKFLKKNVEGKAIDQPTQSSSSTAPQLEENSFSLPQLSEVPSVVSSTSSLSNDSKFPSKNNSSIQLPHQKAIPGSTDNELEPILPLRTQDTSAFAPTFSSLCTYDSSITQQSVNESEVKRVEELQEEEDLSTQPDTAEKLKGNIIKQRKVFPKLRKTSTPNNSPPNTEHELSSHNQKILDELAEADESLDFFQRTDDVFEDFSMEFSCRLSPIPKDMNRGSDKDDDSKWKKYIIPSGESPEGSVLMGASDDLGLGLYQRVTTELNLENIPRNVNEDPHKNSNYDGIEDVVVPSLYASNYNVMHTLLTNTESSPMDMCSTVYTEDPFVSNSNASLDTEDNVYYDTFDLLDENYKKKNKNRVGIRGNEHVDDDDDDDESDKSTKNNLFCSNRPVTKLIPKKLFTEEEPGEIIDNSSRCPNEISSIPQEASTFNNTSKFTSNSNEVNTMDTDRNVFNGAKNSTPLDWLSSSSSAAAASTNFTDSESPSILYKTVVENQSVVNNNISTNNNGKKLGKNKTDDSKTPSTLEAKKDGDSLSVDFKFGITTLLDNIATNESSVNSSNLAYKNTDKFVEDIEAEIQEFGSLVMTDLEESEESPRVEVVKETREEYFDQNPPSIQRVIAFESSKPFTDDENDGTKISTRDYKLDQVPSDTNDEINDTSTHSYDADKSNGDSGKEISYLPLNQSTELDKVDNSRSLLVTDFESDHDDENDEETVSRDIRDFVPSKWNEKLTPLRPAIKSPEQQKTHASSASSFDSSTSVVGSSYNNSSSNNNHGGAMEKSSLKKSVSFERKKTQLVYEYPPAPVASDSDEEDKQQQKIQSLTNNNSQLNSFLDWELQPDELEHTDNNLDDWEDEFSRNSRNRSRTDNSNSMDMYRLVGLGAGCGYPVPPPRANPPSSSSFQPSTIMRNSGIGAGTSSLGELRHTRERLKLDLHTHITGEASLLDSSDLKTCSEKHQEQQQQLDSGVGSTSSTTFSPFNNCDNY